MKPGFGLKERKGVRILVKKTHSKMFTVLTAVLFELNPKPTEHRVVGNT